MRRKSFGETAALGGGALLGDRWVRRIYIDDAGISAKESEPFSVAAGVILNPDADWKKVQQYLAALKEEYVPKEKQNDFAAFHATEIFSGGKTFKRDEYPAWRRWELLEKLATIPGKFSIPVSVGFKSKASVAAPRLESRQKEAWWAHLLAFCHCIIGCDDAMSAWYPGEVASIVAEDCPQMHKTLKRVPRLLGEESHVVKDLFREHVPIKNIVDDIHFGDKRSSPILQVADVCAFIACRALAGKRHSARWWATLIGETGTPISPRIVETGGAAFTLAFGPSSKIRFGKSPANSFRPLWCL